MISYENYANFRNSQGMKDAEVAKLAGIPQSTFSDWKKGKSTPKQQKMEKIANALGMSYSDFVGEKRTTTIDVTRTLDAIAKSALKSIELNAEEDELIRNFRSLDGDSKKQLLLMMAFFKDHHPED